MILVHFGNWLPEQKHNNSQYFSNVGSVFCFSFSSSGPRPMSRPGTDITFRGFGGLLSLATMALVAGQNIIVVDEDKLYARISHF